MALNLKHAPASTPFRWKLFLLIFVTIGALTAGAIILTLMAMPSEGGVHAPSSEPVSQLHPLPRR